MGEKNNLKIDDDTLKELQIVLLSMLKDFDKFCRENKIEYWLDSGTCLGAIRHGGFIPWDDDVDIGMLRSDYMRFINCCKFRLKKPYFLQMVETDSEMPFLYAKVRLDGSKYVEYSNRLVNMHKGIYIDVFPYDAVPDKFNEFRRFMKIMEWLSKVYQWKHSTDISLPPSSIKDEIKKGFRLIVHTCLKIVPNRLFIKMLRENEQKYNGKSEQVLCVYFGDGYPSYNKKDLVPTTRKLFEDTYLPVPNNFDLYLNKMYGEWKKYPPEEQRFGHKPWELVLPDSLK